MRLEKLVDHVPARCDLDSYKRRERPKLAVQRFQTAAAAGVAAAVVLADYTFPPAAWTANPQVVCRCLGPGEEPRNQLDHDDEDNEAEDNANHWIVEEFFHKAYDSTTAARGPLGQLDEICFFLLWRAASSCGPADPGSAGGGGGDDRAATPRSAEA